MNIRRVVKKAMASGGRICRRDSKTGAIIIIEPTNTTDGCRISIEGHEKSPANRWQPKARDLLAMNWEVYGMN